MSSSPGRILRKSVGRRGKCDIIFPESHFSEFEHERRPILLAEFHTKRTEILQWGYEYNALLALSTAYSQTMMSLSDIGLPPETVL
jgi:hypothetical protein